MAGLGGLRCPAGLPASGRLHPRQVSNREVLGRHGLLLGRHPLRHDRRAQLYWAHDLAALPRYL